MSRDRLRWKENKKQEFSVKSAYQVALRINRAEVVEHSLAWEDKKLWNKVWKLGVQPKVQNFVWRACSDNLIYYLLGLISFEGRYQSIHSVQFVAKLIKRLLMHRGNVH